MDTKALKPALESLSVTQRKAFLLLVLEHTAAALEVPDRRRYDAYKRAPRFDAMIARRWRRLAGGAAEPLKAPPPNDSVAHLFPEGSTQRRYAEYVDRSALPEDGTVDDDEMLLQLQVAETDQTAAWVFDSATLALDLLDRDDPSPLFFPDVLVSAQALYAHCGAEAAFAEHMDACMAFARAFAGDLEMAAAACSQARARASTLLIAPDA